MGLNEGEGTSRSPSDGPDHHPAGRRGVRNSQGAQGAGLGSLGKQGYETHTRLGVPASLPCGLAGKAWTCPAP